MTVEWYSVQPLGGLETKLEMKVLRRGWSERRGVHAPKPRWRMDGAALGWGSPQPRWFWEGGKRGETVVLRHGEEEERWGLVKATAGGWISG